MADFKKALITGGAGFMGAHLADLLLKKGIAVTVLDPGANDKAKVKNLTVIKGSILDAKTLEKAFQGVDVVFHMAALTHLWAKHKKDFETINAEGTKAVLKTAKKHRVQKLVATSTETILRGWRDPNPFPITENDPVPAMKDMAGPYTSSKWQADQLVRKAAEEGLPAVSVYPTVPVGPGDNRLTAPTKMILDFLRGKTPAYYNALLNFVAIEDIAQGHWLAADRGMPGERFILGGENLAMSHFIEMLGDVSGKKMPTKTVPYELAASTALWAEFLSNYITRKPPVASKEAVRLVLNSSFVSSAHAEKRLGFAPGSVKTALKETVHWFEKQKLVS